MRKFLLVLVAVLALATSAGAAPYRVVDANGVAFGPVIGIGQMIVTAPDGTPVAIFIGPSGFSAGFLQGITSYPFLYLNDPTCTTKPYLSATTVPVRG